MSYEELQRAPYSVFQEMYYKFWRDNDTKRKESESNKNGNTEEVSNVDDNDLEDLLDEIS